MAIGTPAVPEKRQTPRYPVEIAVDFVPLDSKVVGVTRDVSLGGVFVQTSLPPLDGQKLLVTLHLVDGQELLFFGKVVRTQRSTAIRSGESPSGFALAISDSDSYRRFVSSVALMVRSAGAEGQGSNDIPDSRSRRVGGKETGVTVGQAPDELQTFFTISLQRFPDGRILITADDSAGEAKPANVALRKESAVRERLARRHTSEEVAVIMDALSKSGDRATFSQSWSGLDSVRRFWNG